VLDEHRHHPLPHAAACGVLFGGFAVYSQLHDGVPFRALRWTARLAH
jgi:hypothetical protein